jgi:protocatechuate 3,4-dioxygenase beta subunit
MTTTTSTVAADELLREVLARHATAPDRLGELLSGAVRHLHAFVREVGLTPEEWMAGIRFLTAIGQISDEVRQEFILLSDTLGVSSLVETLAYEGAAGATENTVLGPFYVPGSPPREFGASMLVDADPGDRVVVRGTVTDAAGRPLAATLDAWQNASSGYYACQQPAVQRPENLRGVYRTRDDGSYELRTVRPTPYSIPDDGPVGAMLRAAGRQQMRPGHVHLMVSAPGYRTLVTHVFDAASPHLDDDAVFGVRRSLVRSFEPDAGGELAATFDITLVPAATS